MMCSFHIELVTSSYCSLEITQNVARVRETCVVWRQVHSLSAIFSGPDVYVVTDGHRLSRDQCSHVIGQLNNRRPRQSSRDVVNNATRPPHSRRATDQRHKRAATSQYIMILSL